MNRREFLRGAAGVALTAAGGCQWLRGPVTAGGLRLGVQMWSISELWKKDLEGSFAKLRALGYEGVQSLGFYDLDRKRLEKALDANGLRIVDMPFQLRHLAPENRNAYLEFCDQFGIRFVYDGWERFEGPKAGDEWRKVVEKLAGFAAELRPRGIRVGYHNHQHELKERYDGKSPLEMLEAAGLDFELDVGHCKLAGSDPVAWLKKLAGRVPSIHAKPGGGNSVGGEGDANDWPAILAAAAAAGTRWAVVECETRRDTYDDVEASIRYLRS